jgi:two-component system, OmpR family, response regulator
MVCNRVLLVDDEAPFVEALGKRLNARELDVETAGSGEDAIARVEQRTFDVIVLDLAMPGMDGIETLKRLRKIDPDLQIILLTGHGSIEKAVEATKLGAIDFLQKPTVLSDLLDLIHKASDKRALLAAQRASEKAADVINRRGW